MTDNRKLHNQVQHSDCAVRQLDFSLVTVGAEWLPSDLKIQAYSNGLLWNGWVMPYFTIEDARKLLDFMPNLRYDQSRDAFICTQEDQAEEEVYGAVNVQLGGLPLTTYAIGAGYWCWYLEE